MVSKIALSGFSGVSAINSVPVAGPARVACVAVNGCGVADVSGEECLSGSNEHIDAKVRINRAFLQFIFHAFS